MQTKPTTARPPGYVLHSDAWRVVIATGFRRRSSNRKTGPMIQVWILTRREDPVAAVASGGDAAICGGCPMRGEVVSGAKGRKRRRCYVNVGQAPASVWSAWRRGAYPAMPSVDVFKDRRVRFGAYGDPAFIPLPLLSAIASASDGWTGYTHQWRRPWMAGYRRFIMASVDSDAERQAAQAAGWRTFQVVPRRGRPAGRVGSLCPSERGVSCHDCLRCCGTASDTRSIWIPAHGTGARWVA